VPSSAPPFRGNHARNRGSYGNDYRVTRARIFLTTDFDVSGWYAGPCDPTPPMRCWCVARTGSGGWDRRSRWRSRRSARSTASSPCATSGRSPRARRPRAPSGASWRRSRSSRSGSRSTTLGDELLEQSRAERAIASRYNCSCGRRPSVLTRHWRSSICRLSGGGRCRLSRRPPSFPH